MPANQGPWYGRAISGPPGGRQEPLKALAIVLYSGTLFSGGDDLPARPCCRADKETLE